jgi:hypothetical protein
MELERLAKRVRFSKPVASAIAALFVAGCYGGGESPAVSSVAAEGLTSSTTILAAAFNGTRWASIGGLQPDIVNLPGGEYQVDPVNDDGDFKAFLDPTVGNPAPSLHIYGEGASSGSVAISLASHGSYTKPQEFTVQVQLTGSAVMLVGFYSTPPAAGEDTLTGFTGLAFDTKGGSLTLVESGVNKTTLAFKGTYAFHAFNTLAYTVDTLRACQPTTA